MKTCWAMQTLCAKGLVKFRLTAVNGGESDKLMTDENLVAELDRGKQDEKRGTYKRADVLKMHAYRDAIRRTQGRM